MTLVFKDMGTDFPFIRQQVLSASYVHAVPGPVPLR